PANVPTAEIEEDLRTVLTLLPIPNHRQTIPWVRYVTVAAAIMLVVGFYVFMIHPNLAESSKFTETPKNEDITPGGNKATLILADGQEILLDDVANGNIAQQGGNLVYKNSDGRLIYKTGEYEGDYGDDIPMNTITTPRGGQYDITLPDGTKVWINAASSLTYAVTNSGNERIVKLKGEGYFEVAKVNDKPFKVLTDNQTVEVLGTHFNINSYLDEPTIKTTLIEGSVKIMEHTTQHTVTLKPGQQASLDDKNHLSVKQVNVVDAIA